ncbi:MAG: Transcriptional regulatory protein ZraR [candidate division BRC1 bacterium ADurb.Bin183]|nr:MAG: Transcriptional regulatory protein ZraR [candidate division BRC1 bacterium ADurb.Bin183]
MKSDDLKLEELVDTSEGWLGLKGRRLVLIDSRTLAQMRKEIAGSVGMEQARRILTRIGFFWGQADAAAMKRIFTWDSQEEWIKAGARIHSIQGLAKTVISNIHVEDDPDSFMMEVIWNNSFESEQYLEVEIPSGDPICWMLLGHASGYTTFCLGREVYFMEEQCRAKGDRICKAIGRTRKAWGNRLKHDIAYFEMEDIHSKIVKLSEDLKQKQRELARQRQKMALVDPSQSREFVGVQSPVFRHVLELANKVAQYDSTILITGESGVGKEVLARYIHNNSRRAKGAFLAINCGALPDTLLESELFGHTKGAFTGADHARTGLFEEAKGGTLFLDEIGDVSTAMQIKLLRVLQEREILRLGENLPRKVDVRIVAATNKDLHKQIQEDTFREDLFYRLAVVEIHIPPLRERKEDILSLARYLVKRYAKRLHIPNLRLDSSALDYLQAYHWPGNIREMENAIERAAVVSHGGVILPENLPLTVTKSLDGFNRFYPSDMTLEQVEMEHIKNVLKKTGGSRIKAADILGISQATLWRKLKETEQN